MLSLVLDTYCCSLSQWWPLDKISKTTLAAHVWTPSPRPDAFQLSPGRVAPSLPAAGLCETRRDTPWCS